MKLFAPYLFEEKKIRQRVEVGFKEQIRHLSYSLPETPIKQYSYCNKPINDLRKPLQKSKSTQAHICFFHEL
jgi:hypothetical protein